MSTTSVKPVSDPLNSGAAAPLPTKGEGCTRRFDPDAVTDEHGADFSGAAELWQSLQSPVAATDALALISPQPVKSPSQP